MKKNRTKTASRIISVIVSLVMLFSMVPAVTFAAGNALTISGDSGYTYSNGVLNITEAGSYTIANTDKNNTHSDIIKVSASSDTVNITLNGVKINVNGSGNSPFDITGRCTVNIILADGSQNSFDAGTERAAIENNSHSITISCAHASETNHVCNNNCGNLRAAGQVSGAGIGGASGEEGRNITINGGNITALGTNSMNFRAAGIGGGSGGEANDITINGGNVTATGGLSSAGIGGGYEAEANNITITGGTVNATGGTSGAGIGGHNVNGITISGGNVTATGSGYIGVAGIGGSSIRDFTVEGGNAHNIRISGGTIIATGASEGAGIGGGGAGDCTITISGGNITATGSGHAPGIGRGPWGSSAIINITGGVINATGGTSSSGSAPAIGNSLNSSGSSVTLSPQENRMFTVTANGIDTVYKTKTDIIDLLNGTNNVKIVEEESKSLTVKGDSGYVYQNGVLNINKAGSYTIANMDKNNAHGDRIVVSAPSGVVNITLDGVIINISSTYNSTFDITGNCTVNITLADGSKNVLDAGADRAAIENNSHPMTISCAHASETGHICGDSCGFLRAVGQRTGAGIGGAQNENGENITIAGGNIEAASVSSRYNTGIGGGSSGSGRNITITGGNITATGDINAIGGGYNGSTNNIIVSPRFNTQIVLTIDGKETTFIKETDISQIVAGKTTVSVKNEKYTSKLLVSGDNGYTYENGVLNITEAGTYTIANTDKTTAHTDVIVVSASSGEVNITLEGVKVDVTNEKKSPLDITGACTVNITLADGSENSFSAGSEHAGIENNSNPITISCAHSNEVGHVCGKNCGSLSASSTEFGAGIGGANGESGENITISGGIVTATGGKNGAGIGGGYQGTASNITISGGTITATGGTDAPAAIGSGLSGDSASNIRIVPQTDEQIVLTINGIDTTYIRETDITEIASGVSSVKIRIETARYLIVTGDKGYTYENGVLNITTAGSYTIANVDKDNAYSNRIVVSAANGGVNITLNGVNIDVGSAEVSPLDITGKCTTNIILADGSVNSLKAGPKRAAVENNLNPLTISCAHATEADHVCDESCGSLRAVGNEEGAGIGGANGEAGENITILGGNITASSALHGAGIGGGNAGNSNNITVSGGIVNATGGDDGAGIGSGYEGSSTGTTITGGIITAKGGWGGAGVGSGHRGGSSNSSGTNIVISGGIVNATGGTRAAGIGGGNYSNATDITIIGGDVIATGGTEAPAPIGGGNNGSTGTVVISPLANKHMVVITNGTENIFMKETDLNELIKGVSSVTIISNVLTNVSTGKRYDDINEAIADAKSGETIQLLYDYTMVYLMLPEDITLDLNGKMLTITGRVLAGYGSIIDGEIGGDGGVVIASNDVAIINSDNPFLPIYDTENGCYRFFAYNMASRGAMSVAGNADAAKFGYTLYFENVDAYNLLINSENTNLSMSIQLSWTGMTNPISYTVPTDTLVAFARSAANQLNEGSGVKAAITFTVKGLSNLDANTIVSSCATIESTTSVAMTSSMANYNINKQA